MSARVEGVAPQDTQKAALKSHRQRERAKALQCVFGTGWMKTTTGEWTEEELLDGRDHSIKHDQGKDGKRDNPISEAKRGARTHAILTIR